MRNKSIMIAGAGSIGSILGLLLKKAGHDITLYRRNLQKPVEKISVVGVENFVQDIKIISAEFNNKENITFDIVFIAVQRQQLVQILEELNQLLDYTSETIFICLQNGLKASKEVCEYLKLNQLKVLQASIWWSATMISHDQILYHNKAPTYIGIPRIKCNIISQSELKDITLMLSQVIETIVVDEIENETQKKLILNIVSPVFALFKQPYPTGINDMKIREIVHLLFDEVIDIVEKKDWKIYDPKLVEFHALLNSSDLVFHHSIQTNLPPHKVSTQLSAEKYGGKGSNATALLSFFISNGAVLCQIIHEEVMKLPPNYSKVDVDMIHQMITRKKQIKCVLDK